MTKGRLEAFSDAVLAIIITIMVLEFEIPHEATVAALAPLAPKFLSYVLSFVFLGIYWNNHHHLWQVVKGVNGSILWANLHLLFWLSLIPFVTGWMGQNSFSTIPVALYGVVLWLSALAYTVMVRALLAYHGKDSLLAAAIGKDVKGLRSLYLYTAAMPLAFVSPLIALALYVTVAIMWLIPDRRIENTLTN
ncbi:MAG TPA: TMEM175 family protein [Anaerolineales bacterium]|nr:TMEM175 family protein [Anaerolineales bacterium]